MSSLKADERSLATQWRSGLITKEDPLHVHKTLGTLCLLSYLWRLTQGGEEKDMAFASHPEWTLPTIGLHILLNLSSFEFRIPPRRIDSGYRIWPEYRLHSLVFLCRSLACMTLRWFEQTYQKPPLHVMNLVIVMASMAAADLGSHLAGGKHQSGFARQLDVPHGVKYFFSFMQIQATAGCLFVDKRFSIHFIFCMIIQCNAFLMTLRRKNLAGHYTLVSLYAIMLLVGWYICNNELLLPNHKSAMITGTIGCLAAFIRLAPRSGFPPLDLLQNKYVLWPGMYLVSQKLRPLALDDDLRGDAPSKILTDSQLIYAHVFFIVAVITLGIYKVMYDYPEREKKAADAALKEVKKGS